MSKSRDPSEIDKAVQPFCGVDMKKNKLGYRKLKIAEFKFNVVACTLGSTVSLSDYIPPEEPFTHVIVDEAGQAPEMNIWLAMAYFVTPETRLILAGDPMQLGPVTTVKMLEEPRFGYKISMLARLNGYKSFIENPHNMITLTKNYRSHKAIVDIFSSLFYNSSLEHMEPQGHDSLCRWSRLPKVNFPVMFHNVAGKVNRDGKMSSSNKAEADVVVNYVKSLILGNIEETDIGIVSPYKSQAALVRKCLNLKKESKLTVESVEKFQGSERRIILLTAVRNGKELGFLRDPKRLNTALSRAQHLLVVIGHAPSLNALPDWKKFIDYCKSNGSFVKK
uniref:RNA helicase n=1 Tax=Panagrellus redivivus TaxID=6233 RepID=A0A7E4VII4_PANRE